MLRKYRGTWRGPDHLILMKFKVCWSSISFMSKHVALLEVYLLLYIEVLINHIQFSKTIYWQQILQFSGFDSEQSLSGNFIWKTNRRAGNLNGGKMIISGMGRTPNKRQQSSNMQVATISMESKFDCKNNPNIGSAFRGELIALFLNHTCSYNM